MAPGKSNESHAVVDSPRPEVLYPGLGGLCGALLGLLTLDLQGRLSGGQTGNWHAKR